MIVLNPKPRKSEMLMEMTNNILDACDKLDVEPTPEAIKGILEIIVEDWRGDGTTTKEREAVRRYKEMRQIVDELPTP